MTTTLVSLEEYLQASYRPDCDYVDGTILERNLGQYEHARLQGLIITALMIHERDWHIHVLPEQRVKIREGKYRVPDIVILSEDALRSRAIEQPPLLCIEVLSPEDRLSEITERANDYLTLGVAETWIFDPIQRRVYVYSKTGLHENPSDAVLVAGNVQVSASSLFESLTPQP